MNCHMCLKEILLNDAQTSFIFNGIEKAICLSCEGKINQLGIISSLKYKIEAQKIELKNLKIKGKALQTKINYLENRKKRKMIKDVIPNWKLFNFESELEYLQCVNTCDFHNNDISINDKGNPACGSLTKAKNCIIWIYQQRLKTRIEIERQEQTPLIYCQRTGKNKGCNFDFGINDDLEKKKGGK